MGQTKQQAASANMKKEKSRFLPALWLALLQCNWLGYYEQHATTLPPPRKAKTRKGVSVDKKPEYQTTRRGPSCSWEIRGPLLEPKHNTTHNTNTE